MVSNIYLFQTTNVDGAAFMFFHLLCIHSPSVQFLDCKTRPSQSLPPFFGAGAVHSLRRQWVHSVPHVDHLLHAVHLPSTVSKKTKQNKGIVREIQTHMCAYVNRTINLLDAFRCPFTVHKRWWKKFSVYSDQGCHLPWDKNALSI